MLVILHACYIGLLSFVGMMLYEQSQFHGVHLSYRKVFGNGFNISFFRDFSSKYGQPNFYKNYGLLPIGEDER